MSADRWSSCKNCADKQRRFVAERIQLRDAWVAENYGRTPLDQFEMERARHQEIIATAQAKLDKIAGEFEEGDFREDYEIFTQDGVVHVDYSGHCKKCGYGVDFEYEHPIPAPA